MQSHRRPVRPLGSLFLAVVAAAALCASSARATTITPNPVDLYDFAELAARVTLVSASTGLPAGGVVLAGAVAPTDVVLVLSVEYIVESINPLALFSVTRTTGTWTGMGWVPGADPDWARFGSGAFPRADAAFASGLLDTGMTGDLVFVSAASLPVGTELSLYFQGYHGFPAAFGSATIIPEPATFTLLALAITALGARRRSSLSAR